MADMEIVNLPATPAFRDDALLVVYVPGSSEPAQKLTGAQLREYAERAAANVKKGDKGDPGDVSSVNGVKADSKGNVTLTPAQIGALASAGGAMTGNINFANADPILYPNINSAATRFRLYSGRDAAYGGGAGLIFQNKYAVTSGAVTKGAFEIYAHDGTNASNLKGTPAGELTWKGNNILTVGNKPYGSYTGNGSAASWDLALSALGFTCAINGNGYFGLVGPNGGIFTQYNSGSVISLPSSECKFNNAKLTIATTSEVVNKNGSVYSYQVL